MTYVCRDPACECVAHDRDPWDSKVPCSPCCLRPLVDALDKPLSRGAGYGWCPDAGRRCRTTRWPEDWWDWRDRDLFDHRDLIPAAEAAELAANAEPPETAPMDQEHR